MSAGSLSPLKWSKTLGANFRGKKTAADAGHIGRDLAATPAHPRHLGRALWDRVQTTYQIADSGGIELLLLACEATDRVGALRQEIAKDGAVIRTRGAVKEHPPCVPR